jgi:hypothetical protein
VFLALNPSFLSLAVFRASNRALSRDPVEGKKSKSRVLQLYGGQAGENQVL